MTTLKGNLRKLEAKLDQNKVEYKLRLYDVLEKQEQTIDLNACVGKDIRIGFTNQIHCVATGKKIKKAYGEGFSWEAFESSPLADPSIMKPELSTAHLGIARRDLEWEIKNHVTPHFVYLSYTSGFKVGVTRSTQIPTRWIDQGAVLALKLAKTPHRADAGKIEIALKDFVADKTNWRKMLSIQSIDNQKIIDLKIELKTKIPNEFQSLILEDETPQILEFPVINYPEKVKSLKLDKVPVIEKKLVGIKGQYLMFDDHSVINLRSHSGYEIEFEASI